MHQFNASKDIAVPVDRVWDLLNDFANTYVYHPMVERSSSTNGKRSGLGARRQCTMYDGSTVEEVVTAYDSKARRYSLEVVDFGPMPLKHMSATIAVQPTLGGARVILSGDFQPKFGPLGWVMAKTMMTVQFNKMMGRLLDGVDEHLKTGRIVGKGGKPGPALTPAMLDVG
ncbi:MAG: hypothetical protein ACI9WU_001354 [Myxococcota bacterium]|jgi:hypothetical protein